jgi:hypothetical protein
LSDSSYLVRKPSRNNFDMTRLAREMEALVLYLLPDLPVTIDIPT